MATSVFGDPKCRTCTKCCRFPCLATANQAAPFSEEEKERLGTRLLNEVLRRENQHTGEPAVAGAACQFLSELTGECLIYDNRPGVCRRFEVDGSECREAILAVERGAWRTP